MPRATRLVVLALFIALAVTGLTGVLGPAVPTAAALTTGAQIDVVIDEITPLIPRPAGTLTITGRLVNTSSTALEQVSVRLRTSTEPIGERALIDEIADAALTPDRPYDNRYFDATRVTIDGGLAPGQVAPFTMRVPLKSLQLDAPGAYTLSVEALGRGAGDEFDERLGIQRTFLPWVPERSNTPPIGLTWLWPLADWPARDAAGTFVDDRTPRELGPGGRLHDLVSIGSAFASTVTWVADPELLQSASAIAAGYRVMRDGTPVVGDRSADASAWLVALRNAVRGRTLHVLPYADVDAGAMRRAKLGDDVVRSVTSAPAVAKSALNATIAGGLAWAPSGRFDKQTANLLATAGVRDVVLSGAAMPPADEADHRATASGIADYGTSSGAINALLVDTGLQNALGLPQSTAAEVLAARQQFLAHTAVIATQQSAMPGRVIVAAPPSLRWAPDRRLVMSLLRATTNAPWLRPASIGELREAPRIPRKRSSYAEDDRRAELPQRYVSRIVKSQGRLDALVSVLVDPASIAPSFGAAMLRAESSAWRSEPKTGDLLLTTINREIIARSASVRTLSSGTVTFSGDTGRVPVTIANDGPDAVIVGVELIGMPPTRLSSTSHEPIEIAPGHKASLDLEARVIGGDPLAVRVQLRTPEGEPFGDAEEITLMSTAYSRAAAWVVGLAFAAIAVFVVVGLVRRIQKVRRGASTTHDDPSETVSS